MICTEFTLSVQFKIRLTAVRCCFTYLIWALCELCIVLSGGIKWLLHFSLHSCIAVSQSKGILSNGLHGQEFLLQDQELHCSVLTPSCNNCRWSWNFLVIFRYVVHYGTLMYPMFSK